MFIKSERSLSQILESVGAGDLNMFRDVRIRCSGGAGRSESVFCHQTILSSFSPLLSALFASSCSCKSDINIILQDVDIQTVQVSSGTALPCSVVTRYLTGFDGDPLHRNSPGEGREHEV